MYYFIGVQQKDYCNQLGELSVMYSYRQMNLNGLKTENLPFRKELVLQSFLIEHPELFSCNGIFENPEFIDAEFSIPSSKNRIDLLIYLDESTLGIVELKLETFRMEDYTTQLYEKYLKNYKEIIDNLNNKGMNPFPSEINIIGIAIGEKFDLEFMNALVSGKKEKVGKQIIPIIGMTLNRYKMENNEIMVIIDNYGTLKNSGRDYTKAKFEEIGRASCRERV